MEDKVRYPAIALMVVSVISGLFGVLSLGMNTLSTGLSGLAGAGGGNGMSAQQEQIMAMFSGGMGIAIAAISIIVCVLMFFGAWKMYRFESYSLAMTACVLACSPVCSTCCCIGIPFGIWGLVVLMDPQVKQAFEGGAAV